MPQHAPLLKPDGQIAFGSTHFCDLVGIKYDKVAGLSCFDFVFPGDMNAARELFKANRIPHKNALRFRLQRLDGTEVWTDIQVTPLKAETGRVYAITATITATVHESGC